MNRELELYKLCCTSDNEYKKRLVTELGWISNTEFYVWIPYVNIAEFVKELTRIFGHEVFDDIGVHAIMQVDFLCIDLGKLLDIDLEKIFPIRKYLVSCTLTKE